MNAKNLLLHVGSLRSRYPFLPRSIWGQLNQLKRTELFSDFPRDCGPGSPVLRRYVKDPANSVVHCEIVLVDEHGRLVRVAETLPPLAVLPCSTAAAIATGTAA